MRAQISGWFAERALRERWLIGAMVGIMAGMMLWLGVWRPGEAVLARAQMRLTEATEAQRGMAGRLAVLQAAAASELTPLPLPVADIIAQSAGEAGYILAGNEVQEGNRTHISIAAARPLALIAWLQALDQQGIFVEQADVRANSDATISIDATLRARAE
jgi:general secretion pathway protein M